MGLDLFKLVQTCLKISIQMTSVFSHFHKNSEHMLFSTRTYYSSKKSSSKTTKKTTKQNKSYYSSLHSIPPSSQTTLMLLYTYFFPKSQLFICVFNITSMKKEKNSEIYINK